MMRLRQKIFGGFRSRKRAENFSRSAQREHHNREAGSEIIEALISPSDQLFAAD